MPGELRRKRGRGCRGGAWISAGQVAHRLVGDQLGLDDDVCRPIDRLHLVEDRGEGAVHE